jgi:CubicO group peptidase (beta-lactamase class C family)
LGNRRSSAGRPADDSEPARSPITLRHLLTHSAGLSYGIFDPGTPMFKGYNERRVRHPETTLAEMMDALAPLPLSFHPGTGYEYWWPPVRALVEVVSGQAFDVTLAAHPRSAGHGRPGAPDQRHRLVAY